MLNQPAPGEEFRHYTRTLGPAVMMDSHREGSRADTLWTFGLCGCTATLAFRGDRVMLAHYSPLWKDAHRAIVQAFRPERLIVVAPGEWQQVEGKWTLVQSEPWNIGEEQVAYSTMQMFGERMDARMVQYIAGEIRLPP